MEEDIIKKIPPHDDDSEKAVLGSMLSDAGVVPEVMEVLRADDFYQKKYGMVFQAITDLFNEGLPVDFQMVADRIKQMGGSPDVFDVRFVRDVMDSVPTSANARYYADMVRRSSTARQLIKTCENIENACYSRSQDVEAVLGDAEKSIFDLSQGKAANDYVSMQDVVLESIKGIQAAAHNQGGVTGVATGFYDLDVRTAGLQPSDLILVAARPSMGKTAFILNIAEHVAVKNNIPVAIFSLEMSKVQMANRILAMHSSVDAQNIRTGRLTDAEWGKLINSARIIGKSPIIIDDTPGISVNALRSKCRRYKVEYGIGLIMIDYLQLMTIDKKVESHQLEIMEISRALKALAKELDIPVVACSQLSRMVEQRENKRPILSDLRDSGAIEQDADVVMFLYRDEYYLKEASEKKGILEVIIGKQRQGPIGTVELVSQLEYVRFKNKTNT